MSDETNIDDTSDSAEQALSDAVNEVLEDVDPVAALTDDLQRLQADFQNYRKRVDKERSEAGDLISRSTFSSIRYDGALVPLSLSMR